MEKKYSILQVCVDLDGGGVDRYLYNYCTRIDNIHFDFVKVDRGFTGFLEPLLEERGSIIYKVPRINGNIKRNYEIINKISGAFLILVGLSMATGLLGRLLSLLS